MSPPPLLTPAAISSPIIAPSPHVVIVLKWESLYYNESCRFFENAFLRETLVYNHSQCGRAKLINTFFNLPLLCPGPLPCWLVTLLVPPTHWRVKLIFAISSSSNLVSEFDILIYWLLQCFQISQWSSLGPVNVVKTWQYVTGHEMCNIKKANSATKGPGSGLLSLRFCPLSMMLIVAPLRDPLFYLKV